MKRPSAKQRAEFDLGRAVSESSESGEFGGRWRVDYLTAGLAAVVLMFGLAALSVVATAGAGGLFLISQASVGRPVVGGAELPVHAPAARPVAEVSSEVMDRQAVLLETLTNLIERIDSLEASRESMAVASAASERAIRDLRWQMNSSDGHGGALLPLDELGMLSEGDGLLAAPAVEVVESPQ